MVSDRLRADGFDGLVSEDRDCGCVLGDLAPCGEIREDCEAAHRQPAPGAYGSDFLMFAGPRAGCSDCASGGHDVDEDGEPVGGEER